MSLWRRKHIDDDTRTRARLGITEFDYTKSKNTTLIYTPIVVLLIVGGTVAAMDSDASETIAALGVSPMVFLTAH